MIYVFIHHHIVISLYSTAYTTRLSLPPITTWRFYKISRGVLAACQLVGPTSTAAVSTDYYFIVEKHPFVGRQSCLIVQKTQGYQKATNIQLE